MEKVLKKHKIPDEKKVCKMYFVVYIMFPVSIIDKS